MSAPKFPAGIDLKNQRGINFSDPSSNTDAATKQYVDNLVGGLANKRTARLASTANLAVATALANGSTIDGKTVVTGDRIFLKNQTTASENGIYIAPSSGAASRATDFDTGTEIPGAFIIVSEGTVNGDTMWLETTDGPITVGTTALAFSPVTMGVTYTADGNGIELSSTVFSLELDGTSLSKSATGLRIGSAAAAAGLIESSGLLSVGQGTGIQVNANDVAVDTTVVARKYSAACVATTNPQTFNHALGQKVTLEVYLTATWERIFPGITNDPTTGGGTATVDYGGAPTVGEYTLVAIG